jgi:DNA primase
VLCFDSDNAGQNAAIRVLDSLLASGLAIRVATVPAPHDPDSFIKELGGPAFQQLIGNAEGFFDFYLNRLCATHEISTDKGRLAVVNLMAEAVLKTGNAVLSDTYAQKAAQRLGVSTESVRKEFKKTSPAKAAHPETPEEEPSALPNQPPPSERELWLLKFILLSDEQADWIAAHLDLDWVQNGTVREIIAARLKAQADQSWNGIPALLSHFEDGSVRSLITQAVAANLSSDNLSHKIADTARLLRNDHIDRQLAALTRRLAEPTLTQADFIEIEQEKGRLRHQKKQPLAPPSQS